MPNRQPDADQEPEPKQDAPIEVSGPGGIKAKIAPGALTGYRGAVAALLVWIGSEIRDFKAHVVVQDTKIEALEKKTQEHEYDIRRLKDKAGLTMSGGSNEVSTAYARF